MIDYDRKFFTTYLSNESVEIIIRTQSFKSFKRLHIRRSLLQ